MDTRAIWNILSAYHQPLAEELPRLEAMPHKVAGVHGARDPEMFEELIATLCAFRIALVPRSPLGYDFGEPLTHLFKEWAAARDGWFCSDLPF